MLQRKGLAFVSKTPGRTQQINYFDLGDHRYLVDLPGYGYARVSKAEQARWEQLLPTYLQTRLALRGLILIMDIRHPLTPLDALLLEVFAPTGKPIHVLMTKSDKLSRTAARSTWLRVQSELSSRPTAVTCQLFSSSAMDGVEEARMVIADWLAQRAEPAIKNPRLKGSKTGGESLNWD